MAQTFNRRPLTMNTPTKDNIKQYFFNHYNWKGVIDDQNFLAVDQESFANSNNVYVDREGLLRSRPATKIKHISYVNGANTWELVNILDAWTYPMVNVYKTFVNNKNYLTFVNQNFPNANQQFEIDSSKVKIILADEKLFIFTPTSLNYYDILGNQVLTATSLIYVPVISIVKDGILVNNEPMNELTTAYIVRYLYDTTTFNDYSKILGKEITVMIDGVQYKLEFKLNTNFVLVSRYCSVGDKNFADDYALGNEAKGTPLVSVSTLGSMLVSFLTYTVDQTTKVPTNQWLINYTSDGITFTTLNTVGLGKILSMPRITQDGKHVVCICAGTNPGPYALSVITATPQFDTWTNLCSYNDPVDYNSLVIDGFLKLNEITSVGQNYNQSVDINGYFKDYRNFVFIYGQDLVSESTGDPVYQSLYCLTMSGGVLSHKQIFGNTTVSTTYTYTPNSFRERTLSDTGTIIGDAVRYTFEFGSVNIGYTGSPSGSGGATVNNLKLVVKFYATTGTREWLLTGDVTISLDGENFTAYSIYKAWSDNPANAYSGNHTFTDGYMTYAINLSGDASSITSVITVVSTSITKQKTEPGGTMLLDGHNCNTNRYMPTMYCGLDSSNRNVYAMSIVAKDTSNSKNYKFMLRITGSGAGIVVSKTVEINYQTLIAPLSEDCICKGYDYIYAYYTYIDNKKQLNVHTDNFNTTSTKYDIVLKEETVIAYEEAKVKFSYPNAYIVTNDKIFCYSSYIVDESYDFLNLLFAAIPITWYYGGNTSDSIYLANENGVYSNKLTGYIEVDEYTAGRINYFLPTASCELSEYYLANGKSLYISGYQQDVTDFKWYFPKINTESFDYDITNVHPISSTQVAVFLEDSVFYLERSTDSTSTILYRYYKSKLQVGCNPGCDVLTTFDSKYILFTSKRGLVAMSYQEFIASDEQSLSYLSDNIYTLYYKYITDTNSNNEVKLYKFAFWIVVYKEDSKDAFIYDIRNGSWWPITYTNNIARVLDYQDKVEIISNGILFSLHLGDDYYYDDDGNKYKIDWYVESQKLYLQAINYYKHITNITLVSVHDIDVINESNENDEEMSYKLQCDIYRKQIDGNIGLDDYTSINYDVNGARTFVQRLNYGKVNELQYRLSANLENVIQFPLSLNGITVKYKIGTQVR